MRMTFSSMVWVVVMGFAVSSEIHPANAEDSPSNLAPPNGGFVPPRRQQPMPKPMNGEEEQLPQWLQKRITQWKASHQGKTQPHPDIFSYQYSGKQVYLIQQGQMPNVYSEEGKLMGMPWGGFTGQGDGRLRDFKTTATDRKLVWKDATAGGKEIEHFKRRIRMIEGRTGKAQALKSINFWLRSPSSPAVKKFLQSEKKRLEQAP